MHYKIKKIFFTLLVAQAFVNLKNKRNIAKIVIRTKVFHFLGFSVSLFIIGIYIYTHYKNMLM